MSNKLIPFSEVERDMVAALKRRGLCVFTIEGVGRGSRGQLVIDGRNPETRRKCKAVKPAKFIGRAPDGL